jgi:hypothetical protein
MKELNPKGLAKNSGKNEVPQPSFIARDTPIEHITFIGTETYKSIISPQSPSKYYRGYKNTPKLRERKVSNQLSVNTCDV